MNKFKVGDKVIAKQCYGRKEGVGAVEWVGKDGTRDCVLVRFKDCLALVEETHFEPYVEPKVRFSQVVVSKATNEAFRVVEIALSGQFRLNRTDGTEIGGWHHIDSFHVTPWIVDFVHV